VKPEEKDKHMGRQFSIRYAPDKDDFLVRDLGVGYGVFTETIGLIPLKDNQLVNMGESYLVTNIMPATEDECLDYNQARPMEKIKLRVFSVAKSD